MFLTESLNFVTLEGTLVDTLAILPSENALTMASTFDVLTVI